MSDEQYLARLDERQKALEKRTDRLEENLERKIEAVGDDIKSLRKETGTKTWGIGFALIMMGVKTLWDSVTGVK